MLDELLPKDGTNEEVNNVNQKNKEEQFDSSPNTPNSDEDQGAANIAKHANSKEGEQDLESLESVSEGIGYVPEWVFNNLPSLLKNSCQIFRDKRERDVYLTGALGVLGGCFHNVYAFNSVDKKLVSPNLFMFVIAPPASGKGALKYALNLAKQIKDTFGTNDKGKTLHLIIPANISSAGMMELLKENKGIGVMLETEMDTLVNANKQDWGNFSDIIRKCFENEPASLYRKKEKEFIEIERSKMSLAISGTRNQFKQLMNSTENGLFSRGCYYVFENEFEDLQCFGRLNTTTDIDKHFEAFGITADSYYETLIKLDNVRVVFSQEQLTKIQNKLQEKFDIVIGENEFYANVRRMFVSTQKIATILTCLYACESDKVEANINCPDIVLDIAIELAVVYLAHSYMAFELLPKGESQGLTFNQQRLLDALPKEFTRAEAVAKAALIGVLTRTADKILTLFKEMGLIELIKYSTYRKR